MQILAWAIYTSSFLNQVGGRARGEGSYKLWGWGFNQGGIIISGVFHAVLEREKQGAVIKASCDHHLKPTSWPVLVPVHGERLILGLVSEKIINGSCCWLRPCLLDTLSDLNLANM